MIKFLKAIYIIQEKREKDKSGFWRNYRRINPFNPLSYILLLIVPIIAFIAFGVVAMWDHLDKRNPFKYS